MSVKALIAFSAKILVMIFVIRHIKSWQFTHAELKLNITAVGNFLCIIICLRQIWKERAHFFLCFKVKLARFKLHSVHIIYRLIGLDTKQNTVRKAVLFIYIMAVVCNHKVGADFFGNANKLRINSFLLLYAVVLKFYKKVILTEKRLIKKSLLLCSVIVSVKQILRNFTGKTGRKAD